VTRNSQSVASLLTLRKAGATEVSRTNKM